MPRCLPSIAVVTPSYNQGRYLKFTIDSVLHQNYPRLQYRVEDGASHDESVSLLKSYGDRLKWRSVQDNGQTSAINRGFAEINGEIMGYLNSDDVLLPGTLAYVARAFENNPEIDFIYGHRIYINKNGLETGRWVTVPHDMEALKWVDIVPQETMFWRRRVWEAVGPFDEKLKFAFDWDFLLRAQAAGFKFKRLPRFLGCFRVHGEQKTAKIWDIFLEESGHLKMKYLGFNPDDRQTTRSLRKFYCRQRLLQWLYSLGLYQP